MKSLPNEKDYIILLLQPGFVTTANNYIQVSTESKINSLDKLTKYIAEKNKEGDVNEKYSGKK